LTEEITVSLPDLTHAVWRKSSRSSSGGNECVEVAFVSGVTALRDSKNPGGGVLVLPAGGWHAFRSATKASR
jgi:hypothetical protein